MSWKMEVLVSGSWGSNALRFATEKEALAAGKELLSRWFLPIDYRAVESPEPITHQFDFIINKAKRIAD